MTTREGLYKEIFRLLVTADVEVSDPILHHLTTFTTFLCEGTPAHLTRLSDALDLPAIQPEAKEQIVRRFLSSPKISAEQTLGARIALVLPLLLRQREIVLTMDRTEWEKRKKKIQILTVSVCFEGRALPLFWLTANRKGNTSFSTWQDVLRPLLEALQGVTELVSHTITVVADREFASPRLGRIGLPKSETSTRLCGASVAPTFKKRARRWNNLQLFLIASSVEKRTGLIRYCSPNKRRSLCRFALPGVRIATSRL